MRNYVGIYKNFIKRLGSKKCNRVTMTKDIYLSLGNPGNTTIENLLKSFKECMIVSSNLNNRNLYMFSSKFTSQNQPLELWYIHYRMYSFLLNNNYIKIKYDGFQEHKFIWNIPVPFMPIFASYVLASNFKKKETPSVNNFFKKFDSFIAHKISDLPDNENCTKKEVDAWISLQLGKNYFCSLESLVQEKAGSSLEKASILRNDTAELTNIQLYTTSTSGYTSIYINRLLESFYSQCINTKDEHLFDCKNYEISKLCEENHF